MTVTPLSDSSFPRSWATWTASTLAFPVAGLLGTAAAGRVDDPIAALLGGHAAGLVVGAAQALASGERLDPRRWIPATGIGMGLGLLLGASVVNYGTTLGDLALMGVFTGVVLGLAQAWAMPRGRSWAWAAAMPVLVGLGWTVTTLAGIDVDQQLTLFGLSGAFTFSALTGLLLHFVLPPVHAADPRHADVRVEALS